MKKTEEQKKIEEWIEKNLAKKPPPLPEDWKTMFKKSVFVIESHTRHGLERWFQGDAEDVLKDPSRWRGEPGRGCRFLVATNDEYMKGTGRDRELWPPVQILEADNEKMHGITPGLLDNMRKDIKEGTFKP